MNPVRAFFSKIWALFFEIFDLPSLPPSSYAPAIISSVELSFQLRLIGYSQDATHIISFH